MINTCISCNSDQVECLLNLGEQPPSNRYLTSPDDECEHHLLRFGVCVQCGLAQLIDPMKASIVQSRFPWVTYNEPEGHLDNLVEQIESLGMLKSDAFVMGVTYKDDSTLARCLRKGVKHAHRLSQAEDLEIIDDLASLETVQGLLNKAKADELVKKYGQADVLFVRHILEHVHEPKHLVQACHRLTKPGGLIVFEVPDCRKVFDGNDHCFLWEEHIAYFTPETLKGFLQQEGFHKISSFVYPYPMEGSLVAIVVNDIVDCKMDPVKNIEEIRRVRNFATSFAARKNTIQSMLDKRLEKGCRIALFGAGHLAAKFVNFYQLKDRFIGVIDDSPHKQNHYLPGSALPVITSTCLDAGEIDLCLLALSPESEAKVRKSRSDFLASGGIFQSIFSASASSIDRD
jgi:SAM-dependent methyltransferase